MADTIIVKKMPPLVFLFLVFVGLLLAVVSFQKYFWTSDQPYSTPPGQYRSEIEGCVTDRVAQLGDEYERVELYEYSLNHCKRLSFFALELDDMTIRKSKFYDQARADPVIMWLVVLITMSGVAMAAFQLHMSFKLIERGKGLPTEANLGGEVSGSLETGISLKSSVTGLLILTVSLAFFLVYITWVYRIEFVSAHKNAKPKATTPISSLTLQGSDNGRAESGDVIFSGGGLGVKPKINEFSQPFKPEEANNTN